MNHILVCAKATEFLLRLTKHGLTWCPGKYINRNRYFPFKFMVGEIIGKGAMALYPEMPKADLTTSITVLTYLSSQASGTTNPYLMIGQRV